MVEKQHNDMHPELLISKIYLRTMSAEINYRLPAITELDGHMASQLNYPFIDIKRKKNENVIAQFCFY